MCMAWRFHFPIRKYDFKHDVPCRDTFFRKLYKTLVYTNYYTDDVYFSAPSGKVELLMTLPNEERKIDGKDVSQDFGEFI